MPCIHAGFSLLFCQDGRSAFLAVNNSEYIPQISTKPLGARSITKAFISRISS